MKKKVLVLVVPTLRLGGQERVAVNTAKIMMEEYETYLVVFDKTGGVYDAPCNLIDLKSPVTNGILGKQINVLKRAYRLGKIKKKLKADFIHSFGTSANYVNLLAGGPGKRILSFRGYASVCMKKSIVRLHTRADSILCVSKVIGDAMKRNYPSLQEKIEVLYNPYDIEDMIKKGKEQVNDYDFFGKVIITHGRLEEVKNYQRLIKAFSLVKNKFPDSRLLIIGEGSERVKLQKLIADFGLEEAVTMIGFRSNPFCYLSKASLYVLSSYSEGFPNSLIEGMTFLPAVAVDCKSGPREIMSNGTYNYECSDIEEADYGILVKQSDTRKFSWEFTEDDKILSEAICLMFDNSDRYNNLKEKAHERIMQYSFYAYREKLKMILEVKKNAYQNLCKEIER